MRKILITIPTLNSGGVEVSLVRFINELSRDKNNKITLLMLKKEGLYLDSIPDSVEIIEVSYDDRMYSYNNKFSDIKNIKGISRKIKFFNYRMKLKNKLARNDWEGYYKIILEHVNNISSEYDIAIDWHGYGHFVSALTASCVNAKKRAMWIHDEKNEWLSKVDCWLDCYDKIFCVSKSCMNAVIGNFCVLQPKLEVFYNLIDYQKIRKLSCDGNNYKFDEKKLNLITVGRLEWQKGYDILIEIAKKLNEKNINFCWYIIGGGSLYKKISDEIEKFNLSENVKLLGVQKNPFVYIKKCDLYLQPSRHEGYGLAIAEAKVLRVVPIATNLNCIREQITDGENGFLCELSPEVFADKIIEVSSNKKLMEHVKQNLKLENFDYSSEFNKLYNLMEE